MAVAIHEQIDIHADRRHIYIQTRSLQYFAPLPGGEINVQFEVELIVCSLIPVLLS